MPILREKRVWRRDKSNRQQQQVNTLEPHECEHVVAAINVLRVRFGGLEPLACEMKLTLKAVERVITHGRPSAGLALRLARVAGVPVEDILGGKYPKPGACPMCGRGGE